MFCLPLRSGSVTLGVLTLYPRSARQLSLEQYGDAQAVAQCSRDL